MINYIKKYLNARINYAKLEIVDSVSNMIGGGVFGILVGACSLMILFIGSISAAFLLGNWFEDRGIGFLVVMGIYIILLVLFLLFRKKIILLFTNNVVEAAMEAMDNSEIEENED